MRTPQITPTTVFFVALFGALIGWAGGLGGFAVQLRAVRMRVDGHDDELAQTNRRLSKREGAEGRAVQQARGSKLEQEAQQILAKLEAGVGSGKNGAPRNDRELLASIEGLPDRIWPRITKGDPDDRQ